ncbi:MAG: hypothetical protein EOM20_02775 [Spartobacteria bacterium]|nr:hypothetical protein [Spartobacteria bacterium]
MFRKNAEKRPIPVKNSEKLPKMGHFRAKNRENCHFWPFFTDFCRFLALLRACVLGMWLAVRGRLKPEQRTGRPTPGQVIQSLEKSHP